MKTGGFEKKYILTLVFFQVFFKKNMFFFLNRARFFSRKH